MLLCVGSILEVAVGAVCDARVEKPQFLRCAMPKKNEWRSRKCHVLDVMLKGNDSTDVVLLCLLMSKQTNSNGCRSQN